jgi:hypothetical protein
MTLLVAWSIELDAAVNDWATALPAEAASVPVARRPSLMDPIRASIGAMAFSARPMSELMEVATLDDVPPRELNRSSARLAFPPMASTEDETCETCWST